MRAVVVFGKRGVGAEFAGQNAVVQRHPGNDAEVLLLGKRQNLLLHTQPQRIIGKLNAVSLAAGKHRHSLFGQEHGNPVIADFAVLLQQLHGLGPVGVANVVDVGIVELVEIDDILLQPLEAGFAGTHEVLAAPILRGTLVTNDIADLGGDKDVLPFRAERLAENFLASAVAIDVGCIEEVDAQLAGTLDSGDGIGLGRCAPAPARSGSLAGAAKRPRAKADLAYPGASGA